MRSLDIEGTKNCRVLFLLLNDTDTNKILNEGSIIVKVPILLDSLNSNNLIFPLHSPFFLSALSNLLLPVKFHP